MSAETEEPYQLTPFAVAARALGAERWAEDALAELGKFARLGNAPGEVGVIVFPADGSAYFDVADKLQASGHGDAALPRIIERHADGSETELHPAPPATWAIFRALLAERFAAAERTVALHLERGIYEPRTAEAVLHDVACALGVHDQDLIRELFPAVAERADAKLPVHSDSPTMSEEGGA